MKCFFKWVCDTLELANVSHAHFTGCGLGREIIREIDLEMEALNP